LCLLLQLIICVSQRRLVLPRRPEKTKFSKVKALIYLLHNLPRKVTKEKTFEHLCLPRRPQLLLQPPNLRRRTIYRKLLLTWVYM